MLVYIPTIKYDTFIFNPDLPKYHYIKIGFKEFPIGKDPEQIVFYNDLKCKHRQYGLCHYATEPICGEIGDTYNPMGISVINIFKIFSLWDHF